MHVLGGVDRSRQQACPSPLAVDAVGGTCSITLVDMLGLHLTLLICR